MNKAENGSKHFGQVANAQKQSFHCEIHFIMDQNILKQDCEVRNCFNFVEMVCKCMNKVKNGSTDFEQAANTRKQSFHAQICCNKIVFMVLNKTKADIIWIKI